MEIYNLIVNPNLTSQEFGIIILPITGVLLGLVYAAHIYWLQGGFSKLEYTRNILENLMISGGKIVLDLLIGASIVSLFSIVRSIHLVSITFWIFAIVFLIDLFKYTAEKGTIESIFSSKYIPNNYGTLRLYVRKILNVGAINCVILLALIFIVIVYPIILNYESGKIWIMNEKSINYFVLLSTIISMLYTKTLLTQAFKVKKDIEIRLISENENRASILEKQELTWNKDKNTLEQKIILERLRSIEIFPFIEIEKLFSKESWTSRDLDKKPVLDGYPSITGYESCHLNLIIPYLMDDLQTREFIFRWTKIIFKTLVKSKSDVKKYSISFFRKEKKSPKTHFAIIRASRREILKSLESSINDEDFVKGLLSKYFTEAVYEY
ncbi:MAG: hypothetical protein PHS54_06530 [Clostridia bacterium]|nr:hypothetical protein [Clostridia bacterium]